MQGLVFILAILRFYLLGTLELNNQLNKITGSHTYATVIISIISYLIFGQVIDNQP